MSAAPGPSLPPALREALERSRGPVRPLSPPASRALIAIALAAAAAAALIAVFGLRGDARVLGAFHLLGPALVRVAAAAWLLGLAMREGVPGSGPANGTRTASLLLTPLLLVLLAAWSRAVAPGLPIDGFRVWLFEAAACFPREIVAALPALGLAWWLLGRAYPLHRVWASAAGATGAALVADAALHVICPQTAWSHTLGVHGAAVATLAVVAAATVRLRDRRRSSTGSL